MDTHGFQIIGMMEHDTFGFSGRPGSIYYGSQVFRHRLVRHISEAFITSITLIVAAVPEGLPTIVAACLAVNIIKMSKQNALVKKMVACETIGCINVICSDKTAR